MDINLKTARVISGLSQGKIGKAIGISQTRARFIELNPGRSKMDELLGWYEACNDRGRSLIKDDIQSIFFDCKH